MFNIEGTFFALENAGTQKMPARKGARAEPRGRTARHTEAGQGPSAGMATIRWHGDSSTTKRCCSTPIAQSSRRLTMEARSPRRPNG